MKTLGWTKIFHELEREIAAEKGDFTLFALFMRDEELELWDLVASAPWLWPDRQAGTAYLIEAIRSKKGKEVLSTLSRVVVVDPDAPSVMEIADAIGMQHGTVEVRDSVLLGQPIRHAYIFASQRLAS